MAMTASGMANKIVEKLKTLNADISGDRETELVEFWTEISKGILEEFSSNAEVDPGSFATTDIETGQTEPVEGSGGPVS